MSFFVLNLFVGIVIDKFSHIRNEMNGTSVLKEPQRRWVALQRQMLKLKPQRLLLPPESAWRQAVVQLVCCRPFEVTILTCILANVGTMALTFAEPSPAWTVFQDMANYVFLVVFAVEALLKLVAMRRLYFFETWNQFDFAIVCGSLLSIFL